jgi:hypothetical protein
MEKEQKIWIMLLNAIALYVKAYELVHGNSNGRTDQPETNNQPDKNAGASQEAPV